LTHDNKLKANVIAELNWEPSVTSEHIGVTVHNSVVTLSGHVASFAEKHAAEAATYRVKGVKAVAEEIEVQLPFDIKRGDEDIAAAASNRLDWDVSVPFGLVKVQVEKGWLSLSGQVEWHFQKEAALHDVRSLVGVIGINDHVTIKERVNAEELSDNITHALHRSWLLDPKTITVISEGGKIRLTGTVPSWHDRQVAGETAWAAPGATAVDNDLVIA